MHAQCGVEIKPGGMLRWKGFKRHSIGSDHYEEEANEIPVTVKMIYHFVDTNECLKLVLPHKLSSHDLLKAYPVSLISYRRDQTRMMSMRFLIS